MTNRGLFLLIAVLFLGTISIFVMQFLMKEEDGNMGESAEIINRDIDDHITD